MAEVVGREEERRAVYKTAEPSGPPRRAGRLAGPQPVPARYQFQGYRVISVFGGPTHCKQTFIWRRQGGPNDEQGSREREREHSGRKREAEVWVPPPREGRG